MPKRVPVQTVILHRNGKQFSPPIGKVFDFTQEELDDINEVNKDAIRKPLNEDEKASLSDVKTGDGEGLSEADAKAMEDAKKAAAADKAASEKVAASKTAVAGKTASKGSNADL